MPDTSITLTANAKPKIYTVTLKMGTGIESVTGSGEYKFGQQVHIRATALPNYTFSSWSGYYAISGVTSKSYTFTMPATDISLTAYAKENAKYALNLTKGDAGITSVSGSGSFFPGTSVTVTCQVATGYEFSGWASSNSDLLRGSTAQSYSFKMPKGNVTLTAKSKSNQYTITVSRGEGIDAVSGGGKYIAGTSVTVSCRAKTGYTFSQWTSSNTGLLSSSTIQNYSFRMPKGNVTLTARAVKTKYKVTISSDDGIYRVTGAGTYDAGARVTVRAYADDYHFVYYWEQNGVEVCDDDSYTFTMPKNDVVLYVHSIY